MLQCQLPRCHYVAEGELVVGGQAAEACKLVVAWVELLLLPLCGNML